MLYCELGENRSPNSRSDSVVEFFAVKALVFTVFTEEGDQSHQNLGGEKDHHEVVHAIYKACRSPISKLLILLTLRGLICVLEQDCRANLKSRGRFGSALAQDRDHVVHFDDAHQFLLLIHHR